MEKIILEALSTGENWAGQALELKNNNNKFKKHAL